MSSSFIIPSRKPPGFWQKLHNQRRFFDNLSKHLKLKTWEDWYNVNHDSVLKFGGQEYDSLSYALSYVYPEHPWKLWKFSIVPSGYFKDKKNERDYFDNVGKELGIKEWEDWYQIQQSAVISLKGMEGLLKNKYKGSLIKALLNVYPEYPWKIYKFSKVPNNFWEEKENVMEVIEIIKKELKIVTKEDWQRISPGHVQAIGFGGLLAKYGGLKELLAKFVPDAERNPSLRSYPSKAQLFVFNILKGYFKDVEIFMEFPHPKMQFQSEQIMTLDIFIPSFNLAFEYQGEQHYKHNNSWTLPEGNEALMQRDVQKAKACKNLGITLIPIPYWWDNSQESLIATIKKHRSDLVPNEFNHSPIPDFPLSPSIPCADVIESMKEDSNSKETAYYVTVGSNVGMNPKCKGCGHSFADRNKLRIETKAITSSGSQRVVFCVNSECVNTAIKSLKTKVKWFSYPPFDGKVKIPKILQNSHNIDNLLVVSNIHWLL